MKFLMPLSLVLTTSIFAACATDKTSSESSPPESSTTRNNEPSAKEGWSDVKSGSKEAASGAGEILTDASGAVVDGTKEVGRDIKAGAKELARDVKAATCPVLGHKKTKTYYTKTSRNYKALLSGKTAITYEERECFTSEANAREAGFKGSVN